jgi:hypothetical protein
MPTFSNWKSLESYLTSVTNNVLKNEAEESLRSAIQDSIQSNVYEAHTPSVYTRRGYDDGLIADENIVGTLVEDGVLYITDVADPDYRYPKNRPDIPYTAWGSETFASWINNGDVGGMFGNGVWTNPKSFMEDAADEVQSSGKLKNAIKKGLKRNGIQTD